MFRKQKVKEQLVIISPPITTKSGSQRMHSIPSNDFQSCRAKGRQTGITLTRICSQQAIIAVLDKNEEAWLIGDPFPRPVNLSALLRRRIQRVFLGEKQMIVQSKGEFVLLNWGSVKAFQGRELTRISTFSSNQSEALLFAYLIPDVQVGTVFHYSLEKKVENSNRLYEIKAQVCEIIAHPTLTAIKTARSIKGISIGRHHSLCWDAQGELFSWGCRSLGLGYGNLPSEDRVQQPRPVKLTKHVLMAFAATHYSLALTSEGVLYEWGIKPEFNQLNEEPIFLPRPLQFRFFKCRARFVSLKGRQNNFAALASTGQLYVWGLNARHLLAPNIQLPPAWQGSHIYQPVLQTDFLPNRVKDFSIQVNSLSAILTEGEQDAPQEEYWEVLKQKAKLQLACFKTNRVWTDVSQPLARLRKKYRNPLLAEAKTERKQNIMHLEANSAKKPPSERKARQKHESVDHNKMVSFKKTAPLSSTCWPLPINHKRQVSDFLSYKTPPPESMNLRCSEIGINNSSRQEQAKKFSESYSIRLQGVLQKKQKLEYMSLATNLKRIDEGDIQFKLKKRQEEENRRRREQSQVILQNGLKPFLVKTYLCKLLTCPLQQGRDALIASFSRSLVLVRVEKNIKRLFVDAKVRFSIQALKKDCFPRYALLVVFFKDYVMRFRERRAKRFRQRIVEALVTRAARQRIKGCVRKSKLAVAKIARLGQWLKRFNRERLRILKELWNNFVLVTLKPSDGGQLNLHAVPETTFAQRFQLALEAGNVGSFENYYRGAVRMGDVRMTNKKSMSELKRRANLRFAEQFRLSSTQILPYSLHYNSLRRPKHLEILLSQSARASACWIEVQRKTLSQHLRSLLVQHDKTFYLKQREYQLQLANFIKQRYETFYELRWKFIIEYNKVQRTAQKRRKEKYLRKLLSLVGMQRLVDQDCIPEKSLVLEEALRRRDAPRPPCPILQFDLQAFESSFKTYWESLYSKAKQIRKRNL